MIRLLAAALISLWAMTASADAMPYGWEECIETPAQDVPETCTAHVVASCPAGDGRRGCLQRLMRAWQAWGVDLAMGRTIVDMRRHATRTDRSLPQALATVMAPRGACARTDLECHLGYAIRGALAVARDG